MGRMYRINPTCPLCREEHISWDIRLTDEEQAILDKHTEQHKGETTLCSLLSAPGLVINRKLKCCCCGGVFIANVGVWKEDEIGWHSPDYVPMGVHPL